MNEIWSYLWLVAGITVGLIQAGLLRHESKTVSPWGPIRGLLRLAWIVVFMITAANSGFLLNAAAGWAAGFLPAVFWLASGNSHASMAVEEFKHGADE